MNPLKIYKVKPSIPEILEPLRIIAYNLWWGWNQEAVKLFHRISPKQWDKSNHNPVQMLSQIDQKLLLDLSKDESFISHMHRVKKSLDLYLSRQRWFEKKHPDLINDASIAYFSLEFGLNDCLPIYSGGLGVLSGDHLKSSSDLGIPLTAVGLLYGQGYMTQYLASDGWQHERYDETDFENIPVQPVLDDNENPLKISVQIAEKNIVCEIWVIYVGNTKLYLLNSNIPENAPEDRVITERLYGGDENMRIKQEIIIGIGGIKALKKLGITPKVIHMNEGHSAFLIFERIRQLMEDNNLSYCQAKLLSSSTNVFTTHTPVPAGNEVFPIDMVTHYLGYYMDLLKISKKEFVSLGKLNPNNNDEHFGMTVFALKNSDYSNGVSKLHGEVSRKMWGSIWPGIHYSEIPISHITNGTHPNSWMSAEMEQLFLRYLGPRFLEEPEDFKIWERTTSIPDGELWRSHERRRERLVAYARRKLKKQLISQQALMSEIEHAEEILHPDILTIGFARRFATYKRATMIFRDIDRLKKILTNKERPVQLIFAGKAHPRDDAGKDLIRQIYHISKLPELRRHVVFLENYDMNVARYLVQGCDVWLNTPRRPLEASGTSGMKVCFNGGLNLSILDGWWDEAYNRLNGWAIGGEKEYHDSHIQDEIESSILYDLLENEVVPQFYNRTKDGLPREWIKMMKESMKTLCPVFNTNRMIYDYVEESYIPAYNSWVELYKNDSSGVKELSDRWKKIQKYWNLIDIKKVYSENKKNIKMGDALLVSAEIYLENLSPEDVTVEIFFGKLSYKEEINDPETIKMEVEKSENNIYIYKGSIPCNISGKNGYSVRILPYNKYLKRKFLPNYIKWAKN